MKFSIGIALVSALVATAIANPVQVGVGGFSNSTTTGHLDARCIGLHGWATFYDDEKCSENPGQAVDMGNPSCLSLEFGRGSVFIQKTCLFTGALVFSPGDDCDCQHACVPEITEVDGCRSLKKFPRARSFRFVSGDCPVNEKGCVAEEAKI